MFSRLAGLPAVVRRDRLHAIRTAAYRALPSVVVESLEQRTLFSTAGLVAWYKLDETAGNIAADSSGLGNNGTWINNPTPTTGQIDGALAFTSSGGNRRVSVADDASLDISGPITLSAWIRPTSRSTQYVIKKADSDAVDGYELSLSSTGRVFFRLNDFSTGDTYRIDSSSQYPTNGSTWMHIAGTYDGSTMRLYINGVQQASKSANIAIVTNNLNLGIGGEAGGYRSINGAVDDARVYNRALSASEINDVMNYTGEPTNAAPVVNAGPDISWVFDPFVSDNNVVTGSATDDGLPNGTLTYEWTVISKPANGNIQLVSPQSASTTVNTNTPGDYVLRLTVSDGQLSAFDEMTFTHLGENQAPTVDAGPNLTATTGLAVSISGSATDDGLPQNGSGVSTTWSVENQPQGGTVQFGNVNALSTTATFSLAGTYTLRLWATDGNLWSFDDATVTVTDPATNQPPVAFAGDDKTISLGQSVTLNANKTDDGLGSPNGTLNHDWAVIDKPADSTVTWQNFNTTAPTLSFNKAGVYTIRMFVNDGQYSVTDDVTITVTDAPAIDPALVGWWQMDEGTGNLVSDSSGKGNDGTRVNNPAWVTGKEGSGLLFGSSSGTRVTVADDATLDIANTITLAAWIKPNGTGTQYIIKKARSDQSDGYELAISSSGRAFFRINDDSTPDDYRIDTSSIMPTNGNTWVHLMATYDGSVMRLYVNGQLQASQNATVAIATNNNALGIGAQDNGYRPFKGTLDDVRIYNRALSAAEVAAIYQGTPPVNQPPAVNAGPDRTGSTGNAVAIDATVTDDGISTPLTTTWTVVSSNAANVQFSDASLIDTNVTFTATGTYTLRLTANDGQYAISDDVTVVISSAPANQAPNANAGSNQTITLPNSTVQLNGSVTDDGLPNGSVSTQWTVVTKPTNSTVTFGDDDDASTTATFSAAGTYVLRLTANDGSLSDTDDVQITVNPAPSGGTDVDVDRTTLNNVSLNRNTEHKPQNKLWQAFGKWWGVLTASDGTWVYRLDSSTWNKVLKLTSDTNTTADVLAVGTGGVVHALLQVGTTMKLASIEYVSGGNGSYKMWDDRSNVVTIGSKSGLETATIELDSTGRLWVAYDGSSTIHVRSATGNFSSWSSEQTIASGINSDDLSSIVKLNGKIGVFWSNQNGDRFGFRTHTDGASLTSWSSDEVPGDDAALNIGGGIADDHLHVAVAADGTLYVVVKTSYDTSSQTTIGLLVRRPNGSWDDTLYRVDTVGTRPTVVINELENALYVFYTGSSTSNSTIYYRKTSLDGNISFGSRQTAISGSYNNVTTTRQRVTGELVVMATNSSNSAASAKFTFTPTNSLQIVGSLFYDGDEKIG